MKKTTTFISALMFLAVMFFNIPAFAVKHIVLVGNYFFNPSSVTVSVGDTVRWQWSAGSHTTTSGVIPAGSASWDELITSSNSTYEYHVTVAGNYNYVCTPHAGMGMVASFTAVAITPTLAVSPVNQVVPASSGITTFAVTSNSNWTTSSNASWCTVTTSGSGNGSITANYSENTSVIQRVATITVMVTGLSDQTVTVSQAGALPTLSVGPDNQNVSATSGTTVFNVVSNTGWTSTSNASWCTVTPTGNGNGSISAMFEVNPSNQVRVATITTAVSGLSPQTVTVTQAASTVGVGEQALSGLQVYPNPSMGLIKLNTENFVDQTAEVTIMDLSGKNILSRVCSGATEYSFDLSPEPTGNYFLRINIGGNSTVRRIVLIK